jgi:hypothetical protein
MPAMSCNLKKESFRSGVAHVKQATVNEPVVGTATPVSLANLQRIGIKWAELCIMAIACEA